ncbi:MAG: undecaprenyl-diphosphate phosphatase [Verrucomicrobiota bacterium]|nr:undecaprenyl-diphosphate phosphatase [Verrucomicrobiota bacterium]
MRLRLLFGLIVSILLAGAGTGLTAQSDAIPADTGQQAPLSTPLVPSTDGPVAPVSVPAQTAVLGYWQAAVLGLVEGITEFLPISSTGHLILFSSWLGLEDGAPLTNAQGEYLLGSKGQPLTRKDAVDAYTIVIQVGAIAAVAFISWHRIFSMLCGIFGKDLRGLRTLRNLIVAFLPAAIAGLLLRKVIKAYLFGIWPVLVALVVGALFMLLAERRRKASGQLHKWTYGPDLHELSMGQSLFIGLMQCVAMWPGTSRSMMAIIAGYFVGLDPRRSAEFSFLLGLITLSAASAYEALKSREVLAEALTLGPALLGLAVAFISAAISVRWLINWLTRHGLEFFAWYRIALALVVGIFMFS